MGKEESVSERSVAPHLRYATVNVVMLSGYSSFSNFRMRFNGMPDVWVSKGWLTTREVPGDFSGFSHSMIIRYWWSTRELGSGKAHPPL